MPELPEVETTVRGVQPFVTGVRITLRWPVPRGLTRTLRGHKVASVSRRAKYILLNFSHGILMIHLGMSGRLRVVPVDTPAQKHDHVDLVLSSKKILRFHDPRRFGSVLWIKGGIQNSALLTRLGPEPFDEQLTEAVLYRLSRGRRASIKQFIMDGRVLVGVGNIYASEALFRAGIRPGRAAGRVSLSQFQRLLDAIRKVLSEAIDAGGTTLRDYAQVSGEPGYFERLPDTAQGYWPEGIVLLPAVPILKRVRAVKKLILKLAETAWGEDGTRSRFCACTVSRVCRSANS